VLPERKVGLGPLSSMKGFTLLELLIVLVIMVGAVGVATPFFARSMGTVNLNSGARELVVLLKKVANEAVITSESVRFKLDHENRLYKVSNDKKQYPWPKEIAVSLTAPARDFDTNMIVFYPDGTTSGGRVLLKAEKRAYEIDVNWITGRVSLNDA